MVGRHRAANRSRVPLAAGATVAAIAVATAVTFGVSGGDPDPGEAHLAAHQGAPVTQTTTSSTAKAAASTTEDKPTDKSNKSKPNKSGKTEAKATIKEPEEAAAPEQQEVAGDTDDAPGGGAPCSSTLSGAQPPVAQVGNHILTKFDVDSVGGADGRGSGDHGSGLALDFMVDSASGDALADYVLQNQSRFSATYVIWKQRYNDGSGWSTMEDRGSVTANHYDHVHVSFSGAAVDVSC